MTIGEKPSMTNYNEAMLRLLQAAVVAYNDAFGRKPDDLFIVMNDHEFALVKWKNGTLTNLGTYEIVRQADGQII